MYVAYTQNAQLLGHSIRWPSIAGSMLDSIKRQKHHAKYVSLLVPVKKSGQEEKKSFAI